MIMRPFGEFHVTVLNQDEIIKEFLIPNMVVDEGKDLLIDVLFGGVAKPTWYFGLIGTAPTIDVSDTLAVHAGWTEVTSYTGDRKEAVFSGTSSNKALRSSVAEFVMDADATIGGTFICDAETGAVGSLYSASIRTDFEILNGATFRVSYNARVS